ALLRTATYY
nr:Chain C, Hu64 [Foot-and-mouth disease virus]8GQW_F Chain F, Hu64 [Foot-and-mouth disease virus]